MFWKRLLPLSGVSVVLLLSGPSLAQFSNPAPNTMINNQAVGSFLDSTDNSTQVVESNVVTVTIAEVAGIIVVASGSTDDGEVNPNDVISFDFTITNLGNDPTQFFIPGAPSAISNGVAGTLQIIAYDPDGLSPEASSQSVAIDIPATGISTGDVSALNLPNGSIPPNGTVTVRVPVTVDSGALSGSVVSVTLGETTPVGGSTQNQPYSADTQDLYTQDNLDTDTVDSPLTTTTEIEAAGVLVASAEREASASAEQEVVISTPEVLLVKRITAIDNQRTTNPHDGTVLNQFVDDTGGMNPDADNHANWPANYLIGALNGGMVKPVSDQPASQIEYTIYFLSVGSVAAQDVWLCDRIPANTTFIPGQISLAFNGSDVTLTDVADSDAGYYFPPNVEPSTQFPDINCDGPNNNGAIVVGLGDLPQSTGVGSPTTAYGALRFQVQVN